MRYAQYLRVAFFSNSLGVIAMCFSCLRVSFLLAASACLCISSLHANDASLLVKLAMHAEVGGESAMRQKLLTRAISKDPNDASARWQAGFVRQAGRWLPIDEAESLNAANPSIDEYNAIRDRVPDTLDANVSLARWCRKKQLTDRERLHWQRVIQLDPSHREARLRLHLREFRGQLMTSDEIKDWKLAAARYEVAERRWDPKINRLHREMRAARLKKESEAWEQLASINDPDAVPSLEKLARRTTPVIQLHVIDTMAQIQSELAADALVRLSIDLDDDMCRARAAEALRDHSWYSFVPQYLSALESAIEYDWVLSTYGDFISSHLRLRQERADDVINVMHSRNSSITMLGTPNRRDVQTYRVLVAREVRRQKMELGTTMQRVDENNQRTQRRNKRVFAALRNATGQEIDSLPHLWWDWWKQHNEYEVADTKKERLVTLTENRQESIPALPPPPGAAHECFPAGTPVRTETGVLPIETLRRGDRVLSQNVTTGELSYKLVLETTKRKPSPSIRVRCPVQTITSTLGHPFWVIGKGWIMAKRLQPGDRLHSPRGSLTVSAVEPVEDTEAFNLVVAENNNYFVGEVGVLVHDNEMPAATFAPIPGWSKQFGSTATTLVRNNP
ncbi:MAG: polymorphic toxin-type HINT domain-containing protein [Planctomycetota bacterium]